MEQAQSGRARPREWAVLAAAAAAMIFGTGTTFASLGVVVFAMAGDFGWSGSDAGAAFTVLIIATCLAQMLPVVTMPRIGGRWTMVLGFATFVLAYLIGAATSGLAMLYLAIALASVAFTLVCNTPGIYLIAGWSGARAPQMIGVYLMIGTLGTALGPPVAQMLVSSRMGWPAYWLAMSAVALLLGIVSALAIREPPAAAWGRDRQAAPHERGWRFANDLFSARYLVLAVAMIATQLCVMTVSSVAPAHLADHGWSGDFAARLLGLQGFIGALGTGAAGFLAQRVPPRVLLVGALLLQAVGMLLLAAGDSGIGLWLFAPAFGLGWSLTCFAVTVLLVDYFGHGGGSTALATTWMLSGASAIGPWTAGAAADAGYGYGPALAACASLLLPTALGAWLARGKRTAVEQAA